MSHQRYYGGRASSGPPHAVARWAPAPRSAPAGRASGALGRSKTATIGVRDAGYSAVNSPGRRVQEPFPARRSPTAWIIAGGTPWEDMMTTATAAPALFLAVLLVGAGSPLARAQQPGSPVPGQPRDAPARAAAGKGTAAIRGTVTSSGQRADQAAGSSTVKTAPPSGRFVAVTRPPCSSIRCFTIARPSPVPPGSRSPRDRALSTR